LSLTASAVAVAALSFAPPTAGADVSPTACGAKIAKSPGVYWSCAFADDFPGQALDRSKWSVMRTEATNFSHADECYVNDPSTVSVANGTLRLTARKLPSPVWCGDLFESPYRSGMLFTQFSFVQAYGRFEARVRFAPGKGLHSAWWLWPKNAAYGSQSGEIDIAEHYGAFPGIVSPYVHIRDGGVDRGRGAYCKVAFNEIGFHKYAVEWLPLTGMRFLYDGRVCMTFNNWVPGAPLTYPQPFDQPFFLNLTLALGTGTNEVTSKTKFPATMYTDYVRVWK
jgi:beta-glucanase (GH16 family)